MKRIIPIIGLMAISLTALLAPVISGCKTTTVGTNTVTTLDLARMTNTINLVVPPVTTLAITQEPKARPFIQDAVTAINLFALNGNFDPNALNTAINTAGVNELKTQQSQAAIDGAVGLYRLYYGDVVSAKLDQVTWLKPVLQALAGSLQQGLNATAPTPGAPPFTPSKTSMVKPSPIGAEVLTLSSDMQKIVQRDKDIYLGVYLGMIAESDRDGGVYMFSATSGGLLRWIGYQEFLDVYVNHTKPEYTSR